MSTRITVNGEFRLVDAGPDTPLLYVLRNDLGLNGPKFGCGLGQCGACAAIVAGNLVRTCSTLLRDVGNDHVTTLEGLGSLENPHALQKAFLAEQAAQCGYCTNRIIMAAKVLLTAITRRRRDQGRSPIISVGAASCRVGALFDVRQWSSRDDGSCAVTAAFAQEQDRRCNICGRPARRSAGRRQSTFSLRNSRQLQGWIRLPEQQLRRHLHQQGRARSGHPRLSPRRRGELDVEFVKIEWYPLTPHAPDGNTLRASRSSKAVPPFGCWRRNPGDPSRGGARRIDLPETQLKVTADQSLHRTADGQRIGRLRVKSLRCCGEKSPPTLRRNDRPTTGLSVSPSTASTFPPN
jgi:nicotinate dehydrogenase subunit A